MQAQFPPAAKMEGFASRLALAIGRCGVNQTEFARMLGVSPGFMSDLVRGVKKPGAEFLYSVRITFGISLDWLLTGEGSMTGAGGIDVKFYRTICLHIALAKAAVLEDNVLAQALLSLAQNEKLEQAINDPQLNEYFTKLIPVDSDHDLAIKIYNSQLWTDDPSAKKKNSLESAVTHFQTNAPQNIISSFGKSELQSAPRKISQINIGEGQRIAGGNYYEK